MNFHFRIPHLIHFAAVLIFSLGTVLSASAGDPSFDFNKSVPDDPSEELQDPNSTKHHVPTPHAKIVDGHLKMKVRLPGQTLQYSTDSGENWQDYNDKTPPAVTADISVRAAGSSGKNFSNVIVLKKK